MGIPTTQQWVATYAHATVRCFLNPISRSDHLYGMTMGVIGSSSQVGRDGGGQPCPIELGSDGTG
jgi:hypothetical protein